MHNYSQTIDFGMRNAECGKWNAESGMRNSNRNHWKTGLGQGSRIAPRLNSLRPIYSIYLTGQEFWI